jgi:hypothetical protein
MACDCNAVTKRMVIFSNCQLLRQGGASEHSLVDDKGITEKSLGREERTQYLDINIETLLL